MPALSGPRTSREAMSTPSILALNSGSSSLKFALFESTDDGESPLARGCVDRIGGEGGRLWMRTRDERLALEKSNFFANHQAAVAATFEAIEEGKLSPPEAVGHRILDGGPNSHPRRVDAALLQSLRKLIPLAPLHLTNEISCVESVSSRHDVPQVVCFDSAFYSTLPDLAVRRHAFHGISYESIAHVRGIGQTGLTILAHLGRGSSMVALREGNPVDVHYESEPFGASGSSSDMRMILERRSRDERAALAFEKFCYQAKKAIGALVAVLGGIDNLVFTGGIGEHATPVRERICASLGPMGIRLHDARNRGEAPDVISEEDSPCTVRVIRADEELVIAGHVRRILGNALAST